ncbi:MAG TPA: EamA family transporter [Chloroflexi bacterium]|nr:EamA family transporter [Chloroflexota bacterium]|tara:strand:+ start:168 stop:1121 length:954 start_codon:yes stop_codon:yes gene_type:complete
MLKLNLFSLIVKSRQFRLLLVLFVAIVASSSASLIIRAAQQEASSVVIATYRLMIATLVLLPLVYVRQRNVIFHMSKKQWLLGTLSGMLLGFHFLTWITSLEYTTVASSTILVSSMPVFVVLFSPVFLNEKASSIIYFGIGMSLLGGALIALSDVCLIDGFSLRCSSLHGFVNKFALLGDALAVMGALGGAGYFLIGRLMRSTLPLLSYIFVVYGMAAITLLSIALILKLPLIGYDQKTYLYLILLAIVPQLIGHSSFNWSLKYLPVSYVTMVAIAEPVGATILAWLFLDEIPTVLHFVGGLLCLVGVAYASREVSR